MSAPLSVSRVAFAALALLAVLLGVNLSSAARRYANAFETYDRLEIRLERFAFVDEATPVMLTVDIGNPSSQAVTVTAIEIRTHVGVHVVGGGEDRTETRLEPGERSEIAFEAPINDEDYVRRARETGADLDWRITGRVQVQLDIEDEPTWIPIGARVGDTE